MLVENQTKRTSITTPKKEEENQMIDKTKHHINKQSKNHDNHYP